MFEPKVVGGDLGSPGNLTALQTTENRMTLVSSISQLFDLSGSIKGRLQGLADAVNGAMPEKEPSTPEPSTIQGALGDVIRNLNGCLRQVERLESAIGFPR